jgi:hypothetical protein
MGHFDTPSTVRSTSKSYEIFLQSPALSLRHHFLDPRSPLLSTRPDSVAAFLLVTYEKHPLRRTLPAATVLNSSLIDPLITCNSSPPTSGGLL